MIETVIHPPVIVFLVGAGFLLLGLGVALRWIHPPATRAARLTCAGIGVVLMVAGVAFFALRVGAPPPPPPPPTPTVSTTPAAPPGATTPVPTATSAPPPTPTVRPTPPARPPSTSVPAPSITVDEPVQNARVTVACNAVECWVNTSGRLANLPAGARVYALIGFPAGPTFRYYVQYSSTTYDRNGWFSDARTERPAEGEHLSLRAVVTRNPVGSGATGALEWTDDLAAQAGVLAQSEAVFVTVGGVRDT